MISRDSDDDGDGTRAPNDPTDPNAPIRVRRVAAHLTDAEKAALAACADVYAWAAALRAIKHARGGKLPPDWHAHALDSGLMERTIDVSVAQAHGHAPLRPVRR